MPRVFFKTYGCQMNERDTEQVARMFIEGGYNAAKNREEQAKIYTTGPSESVAAQVAAQQALLQEPVRYLDAEKGVLCMPIEDAMERIVVQNAR